MAATIITPGPPTAIKLGYSLGNLGKSIVWTSFDTFLLYYLVRIVGMSPLAAGGLLTAVMLLDGCADVVVAYWAGRQGRQDILGRLILLGAPVCGASFWMIFAIPPAGWHGVVAAAVVACRLGYTLCDIGHNTLLVRIATTPRDATTVSGMRLIFSAAGAGLVGVAAASTLSAGSGHRPDLFATAAMTGGALYAVTLLVAMRATRHLPATCGQASPHGPAHIVGALWRNRLYRNILCLVAVQAGLIPLFVRALPFVGEALHGGAGWAGTALGTLMIAQAMSLPLWILLARRRSPATILTIAYAGTLVAFGPLAVPSGGAIGSAGLALLGICQAGMNMAIWALLALGIRHGTEDLAGNEALPVGVFLAVLKGSAGIGNCLFATAVAIGIRHCANCASAGMGPLIYVAIIVPILGCVAGLVLVLRGFRRPGGLSV